MAFTQEMTRPSDGESRCLQPSLESDAWSCRWKSSWHACQCCQGQIFWQIYKTVPGKPKATEKYLYTVVQIINHSDLSHEDPYSSEVYEELI